MNTFRSLTTEFDEYSIQCLTSVKCIRNSIMSDKKL